MKPVAQFLDLGSMVRGTFKGDQITQEVWRLVRVIDQQLQRAGQELRPALIFYIHIVSHAKGMWQHSGREAVK